MLLKCIELVIRSKLQAHNILEHLHSKKQDPHDLGSSRGKRWQYWGHPTSAGVPPKNSSRKRPRWRHRQWHPKQPDLTLGRSWFSASMCIPVLVAVVHCGPVADVANCKLQHIQVVAATPKVMDLVGFGMELIFDQGKSRCFSRFLLPNYPLLAGAE